MAQSVWNTPSPALTNRTAPLQVKEPRRFNFDPRRLVPPPYCCPYPCPYCTLTHSLPFRWRAQSSSRRPSQPTRALRPRAPPTRPRSPRRSSPACPRCSAAVRWCCPALPTLHFLASTFVESTCCVLASPPGTGPSCLPPTRSPHASPLRTDTGFGRRFQRRGPLRSTRWRRAWRKSAGRARARRRFSQMHPTSSSIQSCRLRASTLHVKPLKATHGSRLATCCTGADARRGPRGGRR